MEDGPFTIYHPDGRIAREGKFAAGRVDGLVKAYASERGRGEPLRACCVPPKAARLDLRYREGDLLLEVFYDREGRAILSDGRPCPPRPASLPELAQFDEARGGWALCTPALDRFWTVEGTLHEEDERAPDGGQVVRIFDEGGRIREEHHLAADGRRHGPFLRRLAPGTPGPFADARVREERGAFELGQAVGSWTFLDDAGAVVRTLERGSGAPPGGRRGVTRVFTGAERRVGARPRPDGGRTGARGAFGRGARGGRDRDRAALVRFLGEHIMALSPEIEAERGEALGRTSDADVARHPRRADAGARSGRGLSRAGLGPARNRRRPRSSSSRRRCCSPRSAA